MCTTIPLSFETTLHDRKNRRSVSRHKLGNLDTLPCLPGYLTPRLELCVETAAFAVKRLDRCRMCAARVHNEYPCR